MKRFPIGILVAILTMWFAFDASADVRLRFSFPTPNQGFPSETNPGSGIWTVSFPSGPSVGEVYRYNILGDESDTIQHVLVDTGEGTVQLLFQKCEEAICDGNGLKEVQAIQVTGSGQLQIFQMDVEGTIHPFSADLIGLVRSQNGDIIGPITSGGNIGTVQLLDGDVLAPLTAQGGSIIEMFITGNILTDGDPSTIDISAPNGGILTAQISGDVGAPGFPVSINAGASLALTNSFSEFTAANIYADSVGTAVDSAVGRFETTGTPGIFAGSLDVFQIDGNQMTPTPGIVIGGDLAANITLGDALPNASGGANEQRLVVGGGLVAGGLINLPVNGLTSQVILNESNTNDIWVGGVSVGTTAVLGPAYINSASSLGGGAVGLAPFRLHGNDCTPIINACVARVSAPSDVNPIKMRHYGPVIWDGPTNGDPFIIERRGIGLTMNPWIDQSACFTPQLESDVDPINGSDTIVLLTPKAAGGTSTTTLQGGFEYRVTLRHIGDNPANEFVLRSNVPTLPPVADHATEYVFNVSDASLGDADSDGTVNFNDITSVLSNWLSTDCMTLGDADRNGAVVFDDITSVLSNWLASYGDCSAGASGGGGASAMMAGGSLMTATAPTACDRTMEEAIAAMGFTDSKQFMKWFGDLAPDEQRLVFTGLDEWLACQR